MRTQDVLEFCGRRDRSRRLGSRGGRHEAGGEAVLNRAISRGSTGPEHLADARALSPPDRALLRQERSSPCWRNSNTHWPART